MSRISSAVDTPTPTGIAAAIARLITSGDLAAGERLPTVRMLATDLGVSPATVSHAWQALSGVGLIVSRGRSGSFVRSGSHAWLPPRFHDLAGQVDARLDLSSGTPDPALLPDLGPALSRVSGGAGTASYLDRPVIPSLERRLRETWSYEVDAVTVVDGALDAVSRSMESVLRFGDRVVVEDPGFPPVFDLLEQLGAERVPVPLDEVGMRPDALAEALARGAAVVFLQPRAQNPTGRSLTRERAAELAHVIERSRHGADVVVIEDDHSGEISITPDVSLGQWIPDQVLHVRSFSKSHGPDLRIAALGGPTRLIDPIIARRMLGPGWTSRMLQSMLLDLLERAESIDDVNDARRVYAARQRAFAAALTASGIPIAAADGVNTWVPVADERAAVVQLAAAGIRVALGSPFLAAGGSDFVRVTVGSLRADFDSVAALVAAAARA